MPNSLIKRAKKSVKGSRHKGKSPSKRTQSRKNRNNSSLKRTKSRGKGRSKKSSTKTQSGGALGYGETKYGLLELYEKENLKYKKPLHYYVLKGKKNKGDAISHIFVADKSEWYGLLEQLKSHDSATLDFIDGYKDDSDRPIRGAEKILSVADVVKSKVKGNQGALHGIRKNGNVKLSFDRKNITYERKK